MRHHAAAIARELCTQPPSASAATPEGGRLMLPSTQEVIGRSGFRADGGRKPDRRITFCVEGNISVGKSTFLRQVPSETVQLQDLIEGMHLGGRFCRGGGNIALRRFNLRLLPGRYHCTVVGRFS